MVYNDQYKVRTSLNRKHCWRPPSQNPESVSAVATGQDLDLIRRWLHLHIFTLAWLIHPSYVTAGFFLNGHVGSYLFRIKDETLWSGPITTAFNLTLTGDVMPWNSHHEQLLTPMVWILSKMVLRKLCT